MDKIIWQLDADSSRVRSEMDRAVVSANRGAAGIATGFGTATRSHDRFLESNNRVTNQVAGFTRSLLNARSATDVLASGLDRLENSANLSLAAGIGLAAGAVLISKIGEIRKEYQALQDELKALHVEANKTGEFQTMVKLEQGIKRVDEAIKKLDERIGERSSGGLGAFFRRLKDLPNDMGVAFRAAGGDKTAFGAEEADVFSKNQAAAERAKMLGDILAKRAQQSSLKESALSGAPGYETQAAQILITAKEMVVTSFAELAQNITEVNLKFKDLAQSVSNRNMERAGVSLIEAANLPDVVNNSVSYERWKASQDAKRAIGLKGQAESARLNMQPEQAHNLFNQAGEAAAGLTGLKPSEKMSTDLKGALAVTEEQLKVIAENTAKQFVNR